MKFYVTQRIGQKQTDARRPSVVLRRPDRARRVIPQWAVQTDGEFSATTRQGPFSNNRLFRYLELSEISVVLESRDDSSEDIMTLVRRPKAGGAATARVKTANDRRQPQTIITEPVELVVAPAAIERALHLFEQLQPRDTSVILQARKILTQHIFGMVDQGEQDEQKLIVDGLAHLKAVERDHGIKSAHVAPKNRKKQGVIP